MSPLTTQTRARFVNGSLDWNFAAHYFLSGGVTVYRGQTQNYDQVFLHLGLQVLEMKLLLPFLAILSAPEPIFRRPNGDLLRRTAKSVESFWDELQAVNCVETVDQQKLNPNGKSMFRQQTDFDYIAILQLTGNDLIVDESRTLVRAPQHENKLPLLITNGFSTFAAHLPPVLPGRLRVLGAGDRAGGRQGAVADQVPARARRAFAVGVETAPARDTRWNGRGRPGSSPASGAVVRVSAGLMDEHGGHRPEIAHRRCPLRARRFQGRTGRSLAALDGRRSKSRRRTSAGATLHTFSKYKHFSVDVKTEVGPSNERGNRIAVHASRPAEAARKRRHRLWITAGQRRGHRGHHRALRERSELLHPFARRALLSPKHAALKPSGSIGNALGIVGAVLLLLMYLYPLRKKWKWLSKKGKTKHWLDYHILMGLVGPVLITFHSSFKLQGVAGIRLLEHDRRGGQRHRGPLPLRAHPAETGRRRNVGGGSRATLRRTWRSRSGRKTC